MKGTNHLWLFLYMLDELSTYVWYNHLETESSPDNFITKWTFLQDFSGLAWYHTSWREGSRVDPLLQIVNSSALPPGPARYTGKPSGVSGLGLGMFSQIHYTPKPNDWCNDKLVTYNGTVVGGRPTTSFTRNEFHGEIGFNWQIDSRESISNNWDATIS